jgi:hypothetical protein
MRGVWRQVVVGVESALVHRRLERSNDRATSIRFFRIQVFPGDPAEHWWSSRAASWSAMPDTSPTLLQETGR